MFANRMRAAVTRADVQREILHVASRYGISAFVAGKTSVDPAQAVVAEDVLISEWPTEWTRRYIEQDYGRIDPLVSLIRARPSAPLLLERTDHQAGDLPARRRMIDEQHDFGILSAFIVPLIGGNNDLSVLSFTATKLALSPEIYTLLNVIGSLALSRLQQLSMPEIGINRGLSTREREVLLWASNGKTAWETAEILSLSTHTVNQHIKSAMAKLGASNRTQAVALAIRAGIIA